MPDAAGDGIFCEVEGRVSGFHTHNSVACLLAMDGERLNCTQTQQWLRGLGRLPRGCGGWFGQGCKIPVPRYAASQPSLASPPTAAQAPTRISPLPQGNAGVALGITLPLALHSPEQLWGRAGRESSAHDELLGYLGRLEVPAAIGDTTFIPSSTPLKPLYLSFMTLLCSCSLPHIFMAAVPQHSQYI